MSGKALPYLVDALVPVGHGDGDAVGFGGRGEVLFEGAPERG